MKHLLVFILCCFSAVILAQTPNWTNVKETNIDVGSAISVDIFTNRDGNHIIVEESNTLKYYRMNVDGNTDFSVTLENTSVVFPSISGDATRIYVVYRKSNETIIRTKYSTNGGSTWAYLSQNPTNSNASSIESVISNGKLHIAYQIGNQIKYRNISLNGGNSSNEFTVSATDVGLYPRIIASPQDNMVYFLYEDGNTDAGKWRWYNVSNNTWSNVFEGYNFGNTYFHSIAGFNIVDSNLIIYYSSFEPDITNNLLYFFNKIVRNRYDNTLIYPRAYNTSNFTAKVYSTTTNDNKGNTAFFFLHWAKSGNTEDIALWRARSSDGDRTDIINEYPYEYTQQPIFVNLSSAGNEVHTIWKDEYGNNNGQNLRYKYDDQNPLAPTGLTISNQNYHPRLDWNANLEPDINQYKVEKYVGQDLGWVQLTQTSNHYYVDLNESYCSAVPPMQCPAGHLVYYRLKAVDLQSRISNPSGSVSTYVQGGVPYKTGAEGENLEIPVEYALEQNYPNPFNPTTTIEYSIIKDGQVNLEVFDVLGRKVAELVNEQKAAGSYSVEFDASNLPSGIYFYVLTSGSFKDSKKLLLLK